MERTHEVQFVESNNSFKTTETNSLLDLTTNQQFQNHGECLLTENLCFDQQKSNCTISIS